MSLTNCRDCHGKIIFVGGVPMDYTWHTCPGCGYGSAIPTLLHYRNTEHQKVVKEQREAKEAKKPAPVRKNAEIKPEPLYIGGVLVKDQEQAEKLRAVMREAE